MIHNARELPESHIIQADVCIVGAGPAGITIARELASRNTRVALFEGGGLDYEAENQALYQGENLGSPYFLLDVCRLRQLGGTSMHWAGLTGRLSPIDFERREWVPHSGWPFSLKTLIPFYHLAERDLGIPFENGYQVSKWEDPGDNKIFQLGNSVKTIVNLGTSAVRFGRKYREILTDSKFIDLYLYSNLTHIQSDRSGQNIESLSLSTLEGKKFSAKAKKYVLCCGGIENPRILLHSDDVHKQGLGNQHDLVGRYFMEHPMVYGGGISPD